MKAFLQMIAQAPAGPPLQPLPHPELPEPEVAFPAYVKWARPLISK